MVKYLHFGLHCCHLHKNIKLGLKFMKRHRQACSEHYAHSTWAPFVTHATLKWNSDPNLICCSMSTSPHIIAVPVLYYNSLLSAAGIWYTQTFVYAHRKKPQGVISSDPSRQETGPAQPVHWFGTCWLRYAHTTKLQCSSAPFCRKNTASCSSYTCG